MSKSRITIRSRNQAKALNSIAVRAVPNLNLNLHSKRAEESTITIRIRIKNTVVATVLRP